MGKEKTQADIYKKDKLIPQIRNLLRLVQNANAEQLYITMNASMDLTTCNEDLEYMIQKVEEIQ